MLPLKINGYQTHAWETAWANFSFLCGHFQNQHLTDFSPRKTEGLKRKKRKRKKKSSYLKVKLR